MGGHHDRRCRAIGFNRAQRISASNRVRIDGAPAARRRALPGPVWTWARRRDESELRERVGFQVIQMFTNRITPANMVGGKCVPFGRPVVPEVYKRLGLGATETSGSSSLLWASHVDQSVIPSKFVRQPMTTGTPAKCAASIPRSAVSGPTKSMRVPESSRM